LRGLENALAFKIPQTAPLTALEDRGWNSNTAKFYAYSSLLGAGICSETPIRKA